MQKIYIARPGAQKEGPYTLEQINRDLAARKITDTDFWAWHEGLPAWTPLHSVPGVSAKAWAEAEPQRVSSKTTPEPIAAPKREPIAQKSEAPLVAEPQPEAPKVATPTTPAIELGTETPRVATAGEIEFRLVVPEIALQPVDAQTKPTTPGPETAVTPVARLQPEPPEPAALRVEIKPESQISKPSPVTAPESEKREAAAPAAKAEPTTPMPEPAKEPTIFATPSMSSGKSFAALEQIFVFTTGEGPSVFKSEVTAAMLSEAAGEGLDNIRAKVPVHVMGGASVRVLEAFRKGAIPGSVWRALSKIKPAVVQQAQEGAYHLCVRTFPVESRDLVALFLLYDKVTKGSSEPAS